MTLARTQMFNIRNSESIIDHLSRITFHMSKVIHVRDPRSRIHLITTDGYTPDSQTVANMHGEYLNHDAWRRKFSIFHGQNGVIVRLIGSESHKWYTFHERVRADPGECISITGHENVLISRVFIIDDVVHSDGQVDTSLMQKQTTCAMCSI